MTGKSHNVLGMAIPIVFLFLADLSTGQQLQSIPFKLNQQQLKVSVRSSGESAILSDIDDRDAFCKGNPNTIFPHQYATNLYYRCEKNRRETWKCIGDGYFDRKWQRCMPKTSTEVLDQCQLQEDGLYPLYETSCRSYLRCKDGVSIEEQQCPPNQIFSFHHQRCKTASEASCIPSFCSPNNDDFFIVPGTKCKAYYYCRKGRRFDLFCPRGQIFDLGSKNCVDGGICYEPICTGRMNGVYADTTHNCNRYFRCSGGEIQEIASCPKSHKHNGFTCLSSSTVKCEKPDKTAIAIYNRRNDECRMLPDGSHVIPGTDCRKIRTCEDGKTIEMSECPDMYRYSGRECLRRDLTECDESCTVSPDGYYADESTNCKEYYLCSGGRIKERKRCENDTWFDGRTCSEKPISCRKTGSNDGPCIGLPDGFHADYSSGCRGYFYCHKQEVIMMDACPHQTKWNGSHCVIDYRCENLGLVRQCKGVATGLYQNVSSDCRSYVYCKNGEGTALSCPGERLYDGRKCREPQEFTCPSTIRDECYGQEDGYHQDELSNCHSYYFCSNGRKITYICEGNLVFNGSHCVSPKVYNCPYHSKDCDGRLNGYYADESSECRKYYFCLNGKRVMTLHCSGNKIFNGESCTLGDVRTVCFNSNPCRKRRDGKYPRQQCGRFVECRNQVPEERLCPNGSAFGDGECTPDVSCHPCGGNRIGFIPDYASGCKNYFFCIGNLEMMATCPAGTIFNGQVCQDSNTYNCPTGLR